jgi:hypothetical protein
MIQVPVIAVFTKYEQFRLNVEMDLEDEGEDVSQVTNVVQEIFEREYLSGLGKVPKFVQLESMASPNSSTFLCSFMSIEGCMSMKAIVMSLSGPQWMH